MKYSKLVNETKTEPIDSCSINVNEDGVLTACDVDLEAIEEGYRKLVLPEGILEIASDAFKTYNESEVAANIAGRLRFPVKYHNDAERDLRRKMIPKIQYPEDCKTVPERADYIYQLLLMPRLLTLELPATLKKVHSNSFPFFLEEIRVDEDNPWFKSVDGVLYSKDGRTLIRFPGRRCENDSFEVPEGVEYISAGAFQAAVIGELTLPHTLKDLGKYSLSNSIIGRLTIKDGLEIVLEDAFFGAGIKHISLPGSIRKIEDRAFNKSYGIRGFNCDSDSLEVGACLFSGGKYDNVDWWCWKEIPPASFLNADIKRIDIPEGVTHIRDYAFAGCWQTKSITIPDSVVEIEDNAFDLGKTYNRPITLPKHLYRFLYRLPARSLINGKTKDVLWAGFEDAENTVENKEILQRQKESLEEYLHSLNPLQYALKKNIKMSLKQIDRLLLRKE